MYFYFHLVSYQILGKAAKVERVISKAQRFMDKNLGGGGGRGFLKTHSLINVNYIPTWVEGCKLPSPKKNVNNS